MASLHFVRRPADQQICRCLGFSLLASTVLWHCPARESHLLAAAVVEADAPNAQREPEDPAQRSALASLVRIQLPLHTGDEQSIKLAVSRARDRLLAEARSASDGRRPVIVLQIAPAPDNQNNGVGSSFETALALARFLVSREMADIRTVAWLPQTVRGHGVLVALACEEIVMAPDAEIGDAAADEPGEGAVSRTVVAAYREIADAKRTVPDAVAQGMIDSSVEVVKVDSDAGSRILLRSEVEDFRHDHEVLDEDVISTAGAPARFTGRDGRQYGFVKYLAADRKALAKALPADESALTEDHALASAWKPVVIDLRGEINSGTASQISTLLGENLSHGVTWICLRIDSSGGDLAACIDLAAKIADFNPAEVRTLAYVPVEARGGAAVIALACDELVMHDDAKLGPVSGLQPLPPPPNNRQLPPPRPGGVPPWQRPKPAGHDEAVDRAAAVAAIRDSLAGRTDRSWSLMASMIDPAIELFRFRDKVSGAERVMSPAEAAALPDAANWTRGAPVQPANEPLVLTGASAAQLGVAAQVDNFDQVRQRFSIQGEVPVVEASWALQLVEALRSPSLAALLLVLGFLGAYIELKTPGVGVGAVVAITAFALFFWSRYLDQTATSLEIVMFIAGLALLLVEVFVVPGFGVFGLAGGLLVVASLVLASQTFVVPRTAAEMAQLRSSITIVVAACTGVLGAAFALRRMLPKAPLLNRMVLEPPPPEERVTLSHREALADYADLVGVEGVAITDLRPSGKALIDNQLIDVIAEGLPLDRGTKIVVASAHANRVLVRAARRT